MNQNDDYTGPDGGKPRGPGEGSNGPRDSGEGPGDPGQYAGGMGGRPGILSWWWVLLLGVLFLPALLQTCPGIAPDPFTYNELRNQIAAGNVEAVTIAGNRIQGVLRDPVTIDSDRDIQVQTFTVHVPAIGESDIVALLLEHDVPVYTEAPTEDVTFFDLLLGLLPFIIMVWIGYRVYKMMQQRGQGMFDAGKSTAKLYEKKNNVKTTLDDVAGLQSAKEEVQELIDFLKNPAKYEHLGARTPKGVLLVGPPGTGKTLLARAIAGETNAPFYSITGSDFMEMYVGVGASRVRNLFKDARKHSPSIIFIDELDSIGRHRGAGLGGGHDEREQTLNQLLSELDGFEAQESIIVLAATNRPDILDPALLRPGRFDRRVTTHLPSVKDRKEILEIHTRKRPMADDVDLETIARGTPGFSGAELENLINEASLLAARENSKSIAMDHIAEARDKVLLGLERKNLSVSEEERKRIAYHESGHAIAAALLPNADALLKVTVIPREQSMGVTQQLPREEKYLYSQPYLLDRLAVMLAGRAAEEIVYGDFTSGAENDMREATKIARKMIQDWGMSKRLGAFSAGGDRQDVFLGEEISKRRDYSDETARDIDIEIKETLRTAYDRAKDLLEERRKELDDLAAKLIEEEELSAEDVGAILNLDREETHVD
jgi:cell division protease FtsH